MKKGFFNIVNKGGDNSGRVAAPSPNVATPAIRNDGDGVRSTPRRPGHQGGGWGSPSPFQQDKK